MKETWWWRYMDLERHRSPFNCGNSSMRPVAARFQIGVVRFRVETEVVAGGGEGG
jgi:hypothetical protein